MFTEETGFHVIKNREADTQERWVEGFDQRIVVPLTPRIATHRLDDLCGYSITECPCLTGTRPHYFPVHPLVTTMLAFFT